MLNRIFVVDSVTLSSTGTAVSSYVPWEQTTRKLPTQVVVKATGQGAYVRLSNDASAATNVDVLVQGGDHVVLSVQGRRWVSVLSDGASSTVSVGALSTGVSGSAASLDLAFAGAATLDPLVTFTRASTATFFNSAGVLTSAAINSPRFDYNPSTLAAQGLLIEEARTNSLTRSEEFNDAAWTKTNSSITANSATAPSGTVTADKLIEALDVNLVHQTTQLVTVVSLGTYTSSCYAKADTRPRVRIAFLVGASGAFADANLAAGTISAASAFGGGSAVGSSIQAINNGWYRITVSGTGAAGTSGECRLELLDASGNRQYNGDGTSGLFLWGAQLEAGAFPTSYIPTTTTALTRAADVASVNTLSPWYNAAEGTLYVQAQDMSDAAHATSQPRAVSINDNTTNNTIDISRVPASAQGRARVDTAGVNQFNSLTTAWPLATQAKVALAYKENDFAACLGGGSVSTDTLGTIPVVTRMAVGNITTSNSWVGWIQRITYYPTRLSNAQLQAMTA